jgi:PelA/Pel-15E family pectate lyase
MEIDKPSAEILAAIEGAVAWFKAAPLHGQRIETFTAEDGKRDRRMIKDPQAPPQWARFYEIGTNKPIYMGRDSVPRDDYNAIERERRIGYNYAGTWPAALLEVEYPAWAAKRTKQN